MAADQIDLFIQVITGVESTGNPNAQNSRTGAFGLTQIMPGNWGPWSMEVFGRVVEQTPENQLAVSRHKMLQYYRAYGSWEAVAVAWFAGPDRARRYVNGDRRVLEMDDKPGPGGTKVRDYVKKVRFGMGRGATDSTEAMAARRNDPLPLDRFEEQRAEVADDRTLLTTVLDSVSSMIAGGERTPIAAEVVTMTPEEAFEVQAQPESAGGAGATHAPAPTRPASTTGRAARTPAGGRSSGQPPLQPAPSATGDTEPYNPPVPAPQVAPPETRQTPPKGKKPALVKGEARIPRGVQ